MHEVALAHSVVQIVEEEAVRAGAGRIAGVTLELGALSCVDEGALAFSFEAAALGTVLEGARLNVEAAPGEAQCFACEAKVAVFSRLDPCPKCGSSKLLIVGGDQMIVKSVEVC